MKYHRRPSLPPSKPPTLADRLHADISYSNPAGFRFLDTSIMHRALEEAQKCHCYSSNLSSLRKKPRLHLWELPSHTFAVGLNHTLALVCDGCSRSTAFFTSGLTPTQGGGRGWQPTPDANSTQPFDFAVNKELSTLLGTKV